MTGTDSTIETIEYPNGIRARIIFDSDPQNPRTEHENISRMICWLDRYTVGDEHAYSNPAALLAGLWDKHIDADKHAKQIKDLILLAIQQDAQAEYPNYLDRGYHDHMQDWRANDYGQSKNEARRAFASYLLESRTKNSTIQAEVISLLESAGVLVLPLYAYIHSGITVSLGRFSCLWDSGQAGFVVVTREAMIDAGFAEEDCTMERMREIAESEVSEYNSFLTGDVYGIIIERVGNDDDDDEVGEPEELEACGGFVGLDYARQEAASMAKYYVEQYIAVDRNSGEGI